MLENIKEIFQLNICALKCQHLALWPLNCTNFQITLEVTQSFTEISFFMNIFLIICCLFSPPCDSCKHCGKGGNAVSDCKVRFRNTKYNFI